MNRAWLGRLMVMMVLVGGAAPAAFAQEKGNAPAEQPKKQTAAAARQYSAAAGLMNAGEFGLAADEWTKFVTNHPEDPYVSRAWFYLGYCQLKTGKYPEAEKSLQTLITKYPTFDKAETAYLYLGIVQHTQATGGNAEKFKAAAATFAAQLKAFPEGKYASEGLFYLGEAQYYGGEKEAAVATYQKLITDHPKSPRLAEALYAAGVTQEELGKYAEAGKLYASFLEKIGTEHSFSTEVVMRYGECAFQAGDFEAAAKRFGQAAGTEGFAQATHARVRQAAALAQLKQYAEAAKLYEAVSGSGDEKLAATSLLSGGNCYYLAGNYAKARELLGKVIAAGGSGSYEAAHWIARSLLKEGMAAEALAAVGKLVTPAVEMKSEWAPNLLMDQADALYEIPDRRAEAVPVFQKLATSFPENKLAPQAKYMAAFTDLQVGNYEQALGQAGEFQRTYPEDELLADVLYVAAESHLLLKQNPEAEKMYTALVKKYQNRPEVPNWQARLGLAMYLQKKYEPLVATLTPVVNTLEDPATKAQVLFYIGSSQAQLDKPNEALTALTAALAASPDFRQADEALLVIAQSQQKTDKSAEAVATLRKLIEAHPKSELLDRAYYRLGEYLYSQQNLSEAAAAYAKVIANWPESMLVPHARFNLAWSQYGQGQFEEAVATASELLTAHPDHSLVANATYLRALGNHQLKKYEAAIPDLQKFLASKPSANDAADARYVLGLCQVGTEQYAEAAKTYQQILTESPEYKEKDKVLYELAWAFKSQGKDAEALPQFAALAKEFPESSLAAESLFHLGDGHYLAEEYPAAVEDYQQAVAKAGDLPVAENALYKLGWAQFHLEDWAKSEAAFQQQLAKFPAGSLSSDAAFMVAENLFKQEKYEEADAAYAGLKELKNPTFAELAAFHQIEAASKLKNYPQSLALATKFVEANPESQYLPEALYEKAWALHQTGKEAEAEPVYEKVTELTNREVAARARFMIGELYFARKEYKTAVVNFFKVRFGYQYPKWQADAAFEAARCFETLKNTPQARKSYQDIVENFPDSPKVPLAKQKLANLAAAE